MIAMALSCRPAVLIADEPTTALDSHHSGADPATDKSVAAGYVDGVIFITHDMGVVADIADRVLRDVSGRGGRNRQR